MGNTMSCFDRWGKRAPDGPLLQIKSSESGGSSGIIQAASTASTAVGSTTTAPAATGGATSPGPAAPVPERPMRRRQTYSLKAKKSDTEMSSMEELSEESESDADNDAVSASDIRMKKVMQYRRALTKVVKLKTHLFSETVKVTCSKDGEQVQWFKGKTAAGAQDRKKPSGSFPVDKITSVKSQADNTKVLVITVNNPQPSTYNFTFKTPVERESWQEQIQSLMKFMAMK
ncbi:conserved hypothetical protein [Neospora caninum Liverpool]|uniref:PH domain-containing protein n=1 Tax=Neospora caninum (strain Liverpool) TaxID=572307 RepID=F0VR35_NEOCL|nr:conserved hypothetical protein [Neospora caninum Liverpool]CBZ56182.1 conserved hypothetical protein [Neospora caninum Liverpool]CEL70941.1 TPA: hypothetical protein BN1204_066080 [Neospora caninum Liverpool]|eukprot:XP_003886208.1 conserved hypothetical protein [Neospora caninum Liverpool]